MPDAISTTATEKAIIEAVPNFSEGRDPEVMQAIVDAIQIPGVLLLDWSNDRDHNRMVVTIAGNPAAVLDGIFAAVQVAAQRIDLFQQRGEHPRLGATDVVPLVPMRAISLDSCVELARSLGRRIGDVSIFPSISMRPPQHDRREKIWRQCVEENLSVFWPRSISPTASRISGRPGSVRRAP